MLKAGDHVVVTDNTYGGTFRLFDKVLQRATACRSATWTRRDLARDRARDHAGDEAAVRRDADQPGDAPHRPRRRRRASRTRHGVGSSSTTRSPARACSGRIEFGADLVVAQHDEVPERPQRQRRRHRRRRARRRHRVAAVRAERGRRDPEPVRFVAGAARHQDAARCAWRSTTATARRSPSSWRRTRRCSRCYYPGLPDHPAARAGEAPDARASAACCRSTSARSRPRGGVLQPRAADGARREPRRRRDAHLPPGDDDARVGAARAPERDRHHRQASSASRPASRTSTTCSRTSRRRSTGSSLPRRLAVGSWRLER